jgi:ABC-type uncharacterized transport system auxiliary subunit
VKSVESGWNVWKRGRRKLRLAAIGLAAAGLVACGNVPRPNYYTLRVPAAPAAHDPKTAAVLGVERLGAPEVLRNDRILYYESPTQLNFYENHRWSSDPSSMVSDSLAGELSQAGVFSEVRLLPARDPVDYLLRGRLLDFEEVDYEGGAKGRVRLELTLVRVRDHKVLWSDARQAQFPAQGKEVAGVVEALNAASEQVLKELVPALLAQATQDIQQGSKTSP